ncbi:DUF3391 domain-containing protein [Erythrobacter sp. SCSIO 43205]|uniref:HD-GYP domain-containing protein n=1 Tax=Erythrobacter sp. SCSIO 43205 TaxID=2779361 RepID=UPI001CAA14D9|nr:DUF3391 domain-containing protein [Erythrobacter sp. SCSIO 43205]UAB77730.1 DUF3391 domain-containing protein [Erythrobacter sp. SCSIO 43205]
MLKEIPLSSLQMGMFVHKMNGGWFDHPFWKAKFLIDEPQKLRTLQSCSLKSVVIDTSLGKDVEEGAASSNGGKAAVADENHRLKSIKRRQSARERVPKPASTAAEVVTAQALVDNASAKLKDMFRAARLGRAISVSSVAPIVSDIHASINRNSQAFHGLMRCKLKSEFVYRHSLCVSALMISLAQKMNLSTKETIDAGLAGLLLDIGTSYYPKTVNPPNGDFSQLDPRIWQQHVELGHRALRYDDAVSDWVLHACLHHHERIDGEGFPEGLNGGEISVGGKMAAICDTFNFLLNNAGESASLDPANALAILREKKGAFDPDILRKFIESVGQFPVGSFVRLRSGLLGMVIDENPRHATRPLVEVFYCLNEGKRIAQRRVKLGDSFDEDEIIDTADLSGLDLPAEDYLREIIFLAAHR